MEDTMNVYVYESEPGMIAAEDVFNNYGAILIHKNTILDLYSIEKLNNLGINQIKVFKEYVPIEIDSPDVAEIYEENISEFKNVVNNIGFGKSLDTIKVQNIVAKLKDTFTSVNDILTSLNSVREIDDYTYSHSVNVALLSSLISKWINLDETQCKLVTYCGLLHDIGKSKISPEILNKPGPLTLSEFEEIKKHPIIGYKILEKNIAINKDIAIGVLMHHEREDGSGYPFCLKSPQISLYAKIIAIADMFDAMTSNRVYKNRKTPFDVFNIYESEYLSKCNTRILLTFLRRVASFYIGNSVRLNNDQLGQIIFINDKRISKPMVKLEDGSIIDLSMESGLTIVELL